MIILFQRKLTVIILTLTHEIIIKKNSKPVCVCIQNKMHHKMHSKLSKTKYI